MKYFLTDFEVRSYSAVTLHIFYSLAVSGSVSDFKARCKYLVYRFFILDINMLQNRFKIKHGLRPSAAMQFYQSENFFEISPTVLDKQIYNSPS